MKVKTKSSAGAKNILTAAESLFAEKGFDAVGVQAIAKKASVSPANVFYHFKTKRRLYLAALKGVRERISLTLDSAIDDGSDLEVFLRSIAMTFMELLATDQQGTKFFMRELMGHGILKREELSEKVMGKSFGRVIKRLGEYAKAGQMRDSADPAVVALTLFASIGMFLRTREIWKETRTKTFSKSPEWYVQKLADVLLLGVSKG